MITRFLLLVIVITSLSSFKKEKREFVYFLNLNNVDTVVQNKLLALKTIHQEIGDNKRFSTSDMGLYRKEKIEDSNVIAMVKGLVNKFKYNTKLFQQSNLFSLYSLGEMKLNEYTTTQLLYIEANDYDGRELKSILGINIVDRQIVSIIELARNNRLLGWSDYTYSIWSKNKFKIIHAVPTCVVDPKTKRSPLDSYTVSVKNDGTLD